MRWLSLNGRKTSHSALWASPRVSDSSSSGPINHVGADGVETCLLNQWAVQPKNGQHNPHWGVYVQSDPLVGLNKRLFLPWRGNYLPLPIAVERDALKKHRARNRT